MKKTEFAVFLVRWLPTGWSENRRLAMRRMAGKKHRARRLLLVALHEPLSAATQ
jgi:hypothetical protein